MSGAEALTQDVGKIMDALAAALTWVEPASESEAGPANEAREMIRSGMRAARRIQRGASKAKGGQS